MNRRDRAFIQYVSWLLFFGVAGFVFPWSRYAGPPTQRFDYRKPFTFGNGGRMRHIPPEESRFRANRHGALSRLYKLRANRRGVMKSGNFGKNPASPATDGTILVPSGGSVDQLLITNLQSNPTARYNFQILASSIANPTTLSMPALAAAGVVLDGQQFTYDGVMGGIPGWGVGNLAVPTLAGILSITPQTAANSVTLNGTTFDGLALTSPAISGSPFTKVMFWGRSTQDLAFVNCGIFDSQAMMARALTSIRFIGTFGFGQTGNVTGLSQSVLTPLSLYGKTCDFLANFESGTAGNPGSGLFGVNAAGVDNDGSLAYNPLASGLGAGAPQSGLWKGQLVVTVGATNVVMNPGGIVVLAGGTVANGTTVAVGVLSMTAGVAYTFTNVTAVGGSSQFYSANGYVSTTDAAYTPNGSTTSPATGSLSMWVTATSSTTAITATGGAQPVTLVPSASVVAGTMYHVSLPVKSGVAYTITNQSAITYGFIGTVVYGHWQFGYIYSRTTQVEQVVDSEFGPAGRGPDIYIEEADTKDTGLAALVNVETLVIGVHRAHVTADLANTGGSPFIESFTTNGNLGESPGFGVIELGIVDIIQDDTSANSGGGQNIITITGSDILSENAYYGKRIHVGTIYSQLNGNTSNTHPFSINPKTTATWTYTAIDEAQFDNTTVAYTSVPTHLNSPFLFGVQGDGTHSGNIGKVKFGAVRVAGATQPSAGGEYSATVGGAVLPTLVTFGSTGNVSATTFEWESIDMSAVAPTAAAPAVWATAGTFTLTNVYAGELAVGDPIGTVSVGTGGFTYTHGVTNVGSAPYQGRGFMNFRGGTLTGITLNGSNIATTATGDSTIPDLRYGDVVVITASVAPTTTVWPKR